MLTEKDNKLVIRTDTSLANVGNQIAITSKILKSIKDENLLLNRSIGNLFIEGTRTSACIDFKGTGELWISGRMIELDASLFFEPVQSWLEAYFLKPANLTNLNIDLEYINTGSIKYLLNKIIKLIDNIKQQKSHILIKWYCDKDDEDLIESIKIISGISRGDVRIILK